MNRPALLRLAGAAVLLSACALAQAQYVWIDAKGVRQFSDRPPPPDTPAAKILKAPGKPQLDLSAPEAAAQPAADEPAKPAKPTLAERDADFRKRAQERAKAEAKAKAEAEHTLAQKENCTAARQYKAQIESGVRIAVTDEAGEKSFLTDEQRAQRLARVNKVLEACRP